MRLSKITVSNFRCIKKLEFSPRKYTSLIGPNNSGKSAAFRAIDIFLNQSTPSLDEWCKGNEKEPIEISAEFDELLDWERKRPGVASLVYQDKIKLRVRFSYPGEESEKKKPEVKYECLKPEEEIDGWSTKWSELSEEIKALGKKSGFDGKKFASQSAKEELKQIVRDNLKDKVKVGELKWTDEGISIPAAFAQALPQVQLIPAITNASEDSEPGAKTSFGKLLNKIVMPAISGTDEYKSLLKAVEQLEDKLKEGEKQIPVVGQLASDISARLSELITAKVSLGMLAPDLDKIVGANAYIELDDGAKTKVGYQGNGLQRALVFAMLEVIANQNAAAETVEGEKQKTRKTILLFEEPELFMHPHLMRRLKEILNSLSQKPEWQVLVTTHSPFLIDLADDRQSLVIHRRLDMKQPPEITQLDQDPLAGDGKEDERQRLRAILDFHPTVCEAFFARHVVLVEGDTELAVLVKQPKLYELAKLNKDILRDTTVVSCDGKWTIIPIARLLKAFKVPTRVIHDIDRKNKSDEELDADMKHEFHANAKIQAVTEAGKCMPIDDTFEDVIWDKGDRPKSSKDKPYRAWRRVHELCDGKTDLKHVPKLQAVLDFAFSK